MTINADRIEEARSFVHQVELPRAPRVSRDFDSGATQTVLDQMKNQATVVGSSVVSFVTGVTPENRRDIVNCSLLAQLAANKAVPSRDDIRAWYEAYFNALSYLGLSRNGGLFRIERAAMTWKPTKQSYRSLRFYSGPRPPPCQ